MRNLYEKILSPAAARQRTGTLRAGGARLVFTNGCFDILHPGHVDYLQAARNCGDLLLVGLNSDASVRRLKGPQRPIANERERAVVLAALESVDFVVTFGEDTPQRLIELLVPDVLVKGGDWPLEQIVGRETVLAHGGEVRTLPFVPGMSTTGIVERVQSILHPAAAADDEDSR